MAKSKFEKQIKAIKKHQNINGCEIIPGEKLVNNESIRTFTVFKPSQKPKGTGCGIVHKATFYELNAQHEVIPCSKKSPYPSEKKKFVVKQVPQFFSKEIHESLLENEFTMSQNSKLESQSLFFDKNLTAYLTMRRLPGNDVYQFLLDYQGVSRLETIDIEDQICTLIPSIETGFIHEIILAILIDYRQQMSLKNRAHLDLKPENILLKWMPKGLEASIVDFGFVTPLGSMHYFKGTPGWQAPELMGDDYKIANSAADIFSLGKIIALLCGEFKANIDLDNRDFLATGKHPMCQLINSMMHPSIENRPDINQVMQDYNPIYEANRIKNMPQRTLTHYLNKPKNCDRRDNMGYRIFAGRFSVGLAIKERLNILTQIDDKYDFIDQLRKYHTHLKGLAQNESLHSIAKKFIPIIEEMLDIDKTQRVPIASLT